MTYGSSGRVTIGRRILPVINGRDRCIRWIHLFKGLTRSDCFDIQIEPDITSAVLHLYSVDEMGISDEIDPIAFNAQQQQPSTSQETQFPEPSTDSPLCCFFESSRADDDFKLCFYKAFTAVGQSKCSVLHSRSPLRETDGQLSRWTAQLLMMESAWNVTQSL
jgi:hypothetical protein